MRHLIAFDLDGTLIDSRRDLADSANELLAAYGAGPLPLDRVTAMVGEGARMLVARALAAAGVRPAIDVALGRFLAIYERHLTVHTRPYPGVVDAVERLVGRTHLAVLTNKPERHTRLLLDHFGVSGHFGWVVGGDSGLGRKPDPAGLQHLMRASGVAPERTLLVGDSLVDVETARAAGAALRVAGYGFAGLGVTTPVDRSLTVVPDPSQLEAALTRFLGPEDPPAGAEPSPEIAT